MMNIKHETMLLVLFISVYTDIYKYIYTYIYIYIYIHIYKQVERLFLYYHFGVNGVVGALLSIYSTRPYIYKYIYFYFYFL